MQLWPCAQVGVSSDLLHDNQNVGQALGAKKTSIVSNAGFQIDF